MTTFEALQEKVNLLIETKDSIDSLKRDIINKTVYIGERPANEAEYEGALAQKKRDEDRNRNTNEKIDVTVGNYNKTLEEILGLIELDDSWLELNWNVIRKRGNTLEVFDNKAQFHASQSDLPNSRTNQPKPKPKVYSSI